MDKEVLVWLQQCLQVQDDIHAFEERRRREQAELLATARRLERELDAVASTTVASSATAAAAPAPAAKRIEGMRKELDALRLRNAGARERLGRLREEREKLARANDAAGAACDAQRQAAQQRQEAAQRAAEEERARKAEYEERYKVVEREAGVLLNQLVQDVAAESTSVAVLQDKLIKAAVAGRAADSDASWRAVGHAYVPEQHRSPHFRINVIDTPSSAVADEAADPSTVVTSRPRSRSASEAVVPATNMRGEDGGGGGDGSSGGETDVDVGKDDDDEATAATRIEPRSAPPSHDSATLSRQTPLQCSFLRLIQQVQFEDGHADMSWFKLTAEAPEAAATAAAPCVEILRDMSDFHLSATGRRRSCTMTTSRTTAELGGGAAARPPFGSLDKDRRESSGPTSLQTVDASSDAAILTYLLEHVCFQRCSMHGSARVRAAVSPPLKRLPRDMVLPRQAVRLREAVDDWIEHNLRELLHDLHVILVANHVDEACRDLAVRLLFVCLQREHHRGAVVTRTKCVFFRRRADTAAEGTGVVVANGRGDGVDDDDGDGDGEDDDDVGDGGEENGAERSNTGGDGALKEAFGEHSVVESQALLNCVHCQQTSVRLVEFLRSSCGATRFSTAMKNSFVTLLTNPFFDLHSYAAPREHVRVFGKIVENWSVWPVLWQCAYGARASIVMDLLSDATSLCVRKTFNLDCVQFQRSWQAWVLPHIDPREVVLSTPAKRAHKPMSRSRSFSRSMSLTRMAQDKAAGLAASEDGDASDAKATRRKQVFAFAMNWLVLVHLNCFQRSKLFSSMVIDTLVGMQEVFQNTKHSLEMMQCFLRTLVLQIHAHKGALLMHAEKSSHVWTNWYGLGHVISSLVLLTPYVGQAVLPLDLDDMDEQLSTPWEGLPGLLHRKRVRSTKPQQNAFVMQTGGGLHVHMRRDAASSDGPRVHAVEKELCIKFNSVTQAVSTTDNRDERLASLHAHMERLVQFLELFDAALQREGDSLDDASARAACRVFATALETHRDADRAAVLTALQDDIVSRPFVLSASGVNKKALASAFDYPLVARLHHGAQGEFDPLMFPPSDQAVEQVAAEMQGGGGDNANGGRGRHGHLRSLSRSRTMPLGGGGEPMALVLKPSTSLAELSVIAESDAGPRMRALPSLTVKTGRSWMRARRSSGVSVASDTRDSLSTCDDNEHADTRAHPAWGRFYDREARHVGGDEGDEDGYEEDDDDWSHSRQSPMPPMTPLTPMSPMSPSRDDAGEIRESRGRRMSRQEDDAVKRAIRSMSLHPVSAAQNMFDSHAQLRCLVFGRKRDPAASKVGAVQFSASGMQVAYKKGRWYHREKRKEAFKWSDPVVQRAILLEREDEHTLVVHLQLSESPLRLEVPDCDSQAVEDSILNHLQAAYAHNKAA